MITFKRFTLFAILLGGLSQVYGEKITIQLQRKAKEVVYSTFNIDIDPKLKVSDLKIELRRYLSNFLVDFKFDNVGDYDENTKIQELLNRRNAHNEMKNFLSAVEVHIR